VRDGMPLLNNNAMQSITMEVRFNLFRVPTGARVHPDKAGATDDGAIGGVAEADKKAAAGPQYVAMPENTQFLGGYGRVPGQAPPQPITNVYNPAPKRYTDRPATPAPRYGSIPQDYGTLPAGMGAQPRYQRPVLGAESALANHAAVFGVNSGGPLLVLLVAMPSPREPPADYAPAFIATAPFANNIVDSTKMATLGNGLSLAYDEATGRRELRATRPFAKGEIFTRFSELLDRMDLAAARREAYNGHVRYIRKLSDTVYVHGHMCLEAADETDLAACEREHVGGGAFAQDTVDECASLMERPAADGVRQLVRLRNDKNEVLAHTAALVVATDTHSAGVVILALVALTNIATGDAIRVDYGAEYWSQELAVV